jgi:acetyl esterase
VTAEYDRLRDEADAYGRKLDAVGSLVEYLEVPAVDHGYNIMSAPPDAADATRRIYPRIAEHVARATSSGQS